MGKPGGPDRGEGAGVPERFRELLNGEVDEGGEQPDREPDGLPAAATGGGDGYPNQNEQKVGEGIRELVIVGDQRPREPSHPGPPQGRQVLRGRRDGHGRHVIF